MTDMMFLLGGVIGLLLIGVFSGKAIKKLIEISERRENERK